MKSIEEIKASGQVAGLIPTEVMGLKMLAGQLYDRNEQIWFTLSDNEDGWEHVAVHVGRGRKAPTWDVMCKVKAAFWRADECVVQIHPDEGEYFHGFDGMEVLHLWRPVDGDWSKLNSMMGRDGT